MTHWIGILVSVACLLVAQTAMASPAVGPRDAVETAVARFMKIVHNTQPGGAAERTTEIRDIVREMFDLPRGGCLLLVEGSRGLRNLFAKSGSSFISLGSF